MPTEMRISKDTLTGAISFSGTVSEDDLMAAHSDNFGRLLLKDCGGADATAADWLLVLEYIFGTAQTMAAATQSEEQRG